MADIWVTSDTHFGHENIIKSCNRPFSNVEEMNEALIKNWNGVVKDGDTVWHLGDVMMGDRGKMPYILPRLNGKKYLIPGNHDNYTDDLFRHFAKVVHWRAWKNEGLLFTHVPIHPDGLSFGDPVNVHGHIHGRVLDDPRYRNVCVEQTNYTPVNFDELRRK